MDGALISEIILPDCTASQSTMYLQMLLFFLLFNSAVNWHHYLRLVSDQSVCSTVQRHTLKIVSQCHLVQYTWPGWTRVSMVTWPATDWPTHGHPNLSLVLKVSRLEIPITIRHVQNKSWFRHVYKTWTPTTQLSFVPVSLSLQTNTPQWGQHTRWSI